MTTKVLITGGSGSLSRHTMPHLLKAGRAVRLASRGERKDNFPAEVEWTQTSMETGEGLGEAVSGVHTIIHAASSPFHTQAVDVEGTRKLLDIAKKAGVSHFFYISIVGIENFPNFPYYKAKLATEKLIETSGIPYTILRATQFHELLDLYFIPRLFTLPMIALVPTDFKYQLIDIDEVARHMSDLVQGAPAGRVPDIGGPQVLTMGELAKTWAKAKGIKRLQIHTPVLGEAPNGFRNGHLTCPDKKFGKITWEQYLARKYAKPIENLKLQESEG